MAINKDMFFKIIDDKIEQTLDSRSTNFPTILVDISKICLTTPHKFVLILLGLSMFYKTRSFLNLTFLMFKPWKT